MRQVDSLFRPAPESTWDKTLPYLFPFTVTFQDSTNSYIYPRVSGYYFPSLLLNIILTIVTFVVYRKENHTGNILWESSPYSRELPDLLLYAFLPE